MSGSPPAHPDASRRRRAPWLEAALLVALTLVLYIPAYRAGFIWDDGEYVVKNVNLRTWKGLGRIWFDLGATPQYYPLVHSSFWIEHHLWGLNPVGYHAVNALLHGLNAALLLLVLRRLKVPGALFAAALFAVHPVHVESVAWVTERKNTLSAFFYLFALLQYVRFLALDELDELGEPGEPDPGSARGVSWGRYGLASASYLCAIFCKTVTCTFPVAIAILVWWRRGRWRKVDLLPLLPLLAVGAFMGFQTARLEVTHVGAVGQDWNFSFVERCLMAGRALFFYATKLVWPHPLAFFYPRWNVTAGEAWQYLFPLAAVGLVGLFFFLRHRIGRAPLAAALLFTVTLAPALGFVDVYPFRFSLVADHFQYLASLAVLVPAAALLTLRASALAAPLARGASVAVLAFLSTLAWKQQATYVDVETLWRDTIRLNPRSLIAHTNLGSELADQKRFLEAVECYRTALEIDPRFTQFHFDLGRLLVTAGHEAEAVPEFEAFLKDHPDDKRARRSLARALEKVRGPDGSVEPGTEAPEEESEPPED